MKDAIKSVSRFVRIRFNPASILPIALLLSSGLGAGAGPAKHIAFGPHKNTIVLKGTLDNHHHPSYSYILHGKRGEKMSIKLHDVNPTSIVALYSIAFPNGTTYGMKGYPPYKGKLTQTGNYTITVNVNSMASNGTHGKFVLTLHRH